MFPYNSLPKLYKKNPNETLLQHNIIYGIPLIRKIISQIPYDHRHLPLWEIQVVNYLETMGVEETINTLIMSERKRDCEEGAWKPKRPEMPNEEGI